MNGNADFVREQYTQYHETRRQLNGFSWQVPSVTILAILFFTGLDPDNVRVWKDTPMVPAIGFMVLGVFLVVLLAFHIRNLAFLRNFEIVLADMEKQNGKELQVYAHQVDASFPRWKRTHSSKLLGIFLGFMAVLAFGLGVFFWLPT